MNKWSDFAKALHGDEGFKLSSPTFSLSRGEQVFTIGSCFARNIEESLSDTFEFPIKHYKSLPGEYAGERPRGILNKFTPLCMLTELEWFLEIDQLGVGFEDATIQRFFYGLDDSDRVIDLGLQQYAPVGEDRFWERRQHIYSVFESLKHVGCLIITLGLIEQWFYNDVIVQHAPNNKAMLSDGELFRFESMDHDSIEDALIRIVKVIETLNPSAKVVFTVSPVPLEKTFTSDHIYVANARSKSRLLSAVQSVMEKEAVDYFPSYEIVGLLGEQGYESDKRHVKNDAVDLVCNEFTRAYLR